LASLADRITQARRLYGNDSAYVIGLVTGIDWLLDGLEGGPRWKEQLHARVAEPEPARPARPAETPAASPTAPAAAAGSLAENSWIKGVVKWFNNDKGYGFISTESHVDVFVHWRDISSWDRSLTQGDEVEFMVTRTAKGFQAINVMKAGKEGDKERAAEGAAEAEAAGPSGGPDETPAPEAEASPGTSEPAATA
jgi:CspA family cold shock protein